jgi:hypothetical protein
VKLHGRGAHDGHLNDVAATAGNTRLPDITAAIVDKARIL